MTTPSGLVLQPSAPIALRTLGTAELYVPATGELLLGPGKQLALLTFLALTPGRRTSREALLDLLWADVHPDRARLALRQTLFHLRRVLGEHALPGAEELSLSGPLDTDRDRFLAALDAGDLDTALDTYTGPFLPAFGVPGGAAFEQWADLERDRLRGAFLRGGELLVRRHLNRSRFREAHRVARRVRDEAPRAEASWRLLLEAVVGGGDLVAAAVEAEALERWGAEEGVTLEPATRKAIARARQLTPPPDQGGEGFGLVAELTGREREFSLITAAWDAIRSSGARHLHLSAPAGLGKTRLLRDAVARLRAGGAPVVEVRGSPGDRDIPYGFAGELAMAMFALPGARAIAPASASTLMTLNPALSAHLSGTADPATGDTALVRRMHALSDLLRAVADEGPFVLVMDDLHWVDRHSYQVLEAVLARLDQVRLLCLTASRPDRTPTSEAVRVVPLAPLSPSQVASLVTALGALPEDAAWGPDLLRGLHAATEGSPLLVLETLCLAMEEGVLTLEEGTWECRDLPQLVGVLRAGQAMRQRIRALPAAQGWILALLSTAGTALPIESIRDAADLSGEELTVGLLALERLGLVRRVGGSEVWQLAHDEIGGAAREALDAPGRRAAALAIGRTLLDAAGVDPVQQLRGLHHLAAAGDQGRVGAGFRGYLQAVRARRDRRPVADLAAEVLQTDRADPAVGALVGCLPPLWRIGLWNRARQGLAAAILLLAAGGLTTGLRARDARNALAQLVVSTDSAGATEVVHVVRDGWDPGAALIPGRGRSRLTRAALAFADLPPALSPDGRTVAWVQDAGDSTTLDIWLGAGSSSRRLTRQARDDLVNAWLPDGSGLLGMTNRWSPAELGGYDIAVFDTSDGAARPIAQGPGHDRLPFLSPDGTRVAFLREADDGLFRLCVSPFDDLDPPECRLPGGWPIAQLLGWSGLTELVVTLDSAGARPLSRYDWQRGEGTSLLGPHVYQGQMSPDRRWVLAAVRLPGLRGFRDWVIPLDRPGQARQVAYHGDKPPATRWWEGPQDGADLIDRIEFDTTAEAVIMGSGTRLRIRALTAAGRELPVLAPVRWSSNDTTVARVDSGGVVWPGRPGSVTVTASLAGWRTARRAFEVTSGSTTTVLEEGWGDGWDGRWMTFGEPHPLVTIGPAAVRALWTNGDGTYPSFAVTRRSFSARGGLGVEVRLSTPLTQEEWQRSRTVFVPGIDTAALRRGDPRRAPASTGRVDGSCGAGYPGVTGARGGDVLWVTGGLSALAPAGSMADLLGSGGWWTLRIQILPDGRCGVAVNGRPVWLSPESIPLDGEFRLRLGDESFGTRLLHGPLVVWSGVRTGVEWSRIEGSRHD